MRPVRTACTYDCPDACSLLLVDGPDGRPRLRGDAEHPITRGFTCQRIGRHLARLSDPSRLKAPLVREGERLREAGWEEALDLAARHLRDALAFDPASVAFLQGGGSLGLSKELVGHFFRSLGPVTTLRGGVCGEAGEEAQRLDFGDPADHDYTDLASSRAVVLWGRNPVETGPHLVPFLREARSRGASVTLVEVRPTPSDRLADRVVRVAPGGDGFLALAVLRRLDEAGRLVAQERVENLPAFLALLRARTAESWAALAGAAPDDVLHLAALYTERRPVATWVGWGLQRRGSGGRNLRCLDALGLLTGNVGVAGGGVNFTSWRRRGLDLSSLAPATGRTLGSATLARDLTALRSPPARFVYACAVNPVASYPDSRATAAALRGTGFVVVADAFLTDTAAQADLVLPVALMLEEDDVVGSYAHHHVARVRRVLDPPPGVRTDLEIVQELARRLGRADELLADPAAALARMTAPWTGPRNPTQPPVPFAERFSTPTGKARLLEEPPEPPPSAAGFPLSLLTPSHQAWQTSQLPDALQQGPADCFAGPDALGSAGLSDGGLARLVTAVGELEVRVRLDAGLPGELVVLHRSGALRLGRAANALVPQKETDVGEGAAFYDARARLEPVEPRRGGGEATARSPRA